MGPFSFSGTDVGTKRGQVDVQTARPGDRGDGESDGWGTPTSESCIGTVDAQHDGEDIYTYDGHAQLVS